MTLLIEPMRTIVESVIGRLVSRSARPYPFERMTRPPLTTDTTTPGIRSAAIAAGTTESSSDRTSDALCADAIRATQQSRRTTVSFVIRQTFREARLRDR